MNNDNNINNNTDDDIDNNNVDTDNYNNNVDDDNYNNYSNYYLPQKFPKHFFILLS